MIQLYAFGSSSVYGVGAENGGWADLIKQRLHKQMFAPGGIGEKFEFYNFGKSGATINFVQNTYKEQLKNYGRDCRKIALVSVGGNNSKAEDEPDNYVSTLEEYKAEMTNLLSEMKNVFDQVFFVGGGYVDESKTNPKPNPLTGGKSYFINERRALFKEILKNICNEIGIDYIGVEISKDEWIEKYVYEDGLHGNQKAHQLLADEIWKRLDLI